MGLSHYIPCLSGHPIHHSSTIFRTSAPPTYLRGGCRRVVLTFDFWCQAKCVEPEKMNRWSILRLMRRRKVAASALSFKNSKLRRLELHVIRLHLRSLLPEVAPTSPKSTSLHAAAPTLVTSHERQDYLLPCRLGNSVGLCLREDSTTAPLAIESYAVH